MAWCIGNEPSTRQKEETGAGSVGNAAYSARADDSNAAGMRCAAGVAVMAKCALG